MVGAHHGRCARALCGAAAAARLRRLVGRARRRLVAAHGTGGLVATGGARARRHRRRLSALRALARCPAAVSDLFVALTPPNLLACFIGTVLGTVVGVLPGLGPAAAMALVLPLTIKLGPTAGLIMLAGIFSVVALQLAAPLVARAALAFGPAEYFAFALLGVVLLANLTGGSRAKSLAMVVLGIMLSTVGMDPLGGAVRFTFDLAGAQAGLSFIAVTAGLFGVAEVLTTMAEPASTLAAAKVKFSELYPSREELRRSVPPMLRGTVLGFLVGLIPGPAATIASFVSYGVEQKVSKYRHELGTGAIEGVAGPEAANNAAAGGGMIPLLSL